jgi:hypothetical protein
MGVYVDQYEVPYGRMKMSHMIADTLEELHEMANLLGVRGWFQAKASFPQKYFLAVACVLFLGSIILLSNVLHKVNLNSGFNVNMAIGGFFVAAVLFWIGMWIVFSVLGLLM